MFSCCVCNKTSKKDKIEDNLINEKNAKEFEETLDKNPINEAKESPKLNGNATNLIINSEPQKDMENCQNDIEEINKSSNSINNDSDKQTVIIVNDDEDIQSVKLINSDMDMELENLINTEEDKQCMELNKKSLEKKPGNDYIKEVEMKEIDEAQICKIALENGIIGPPKAGCLFQAPAYIERTIIVGPDEDGDDSVFESSLCIDDPPDIIVEKKPDRPIVRWLSQDDDNAEDCDGMQEPPATPVAKDELALRRHRFFSDLLLAANSSSEHRVRFDPLGPTFHPG